MPNPTRLDLRALGVWSKQVRITLADGYEDVTLCTLGDRSEPIERGQEAMQQKLLDYREGSDKLLAFKQALLLSPAADLVELIVAGERAEIVRRLQRQQPDPVTPRRDLGGTGSASPTCAPETEEAFAHRVAQHAAQCRALAAARDKLAEESLERRREELALLPKPELVELALPRRIDAECWEAFCQACDDWVLFRAVRRICHVERSETPPLEAAKGGPSPSAQDDGTPYFTEIEEVRRLHPQVKDQIKRAYLALDAGSSGTLSDSIGVPKGAQDANLPNALPSSPSSA